MNMGLNSAQNAQLSIQSIPTYLMECGHSRSQTEPLIHASDVSIEGSRSYPAERDSEAAFQVAPTHKHKKKPNSINSILPHRKTNHRKTSNLPKSPTIPTFHTKIEPRDAQSTPNTSTDSITIPITPLVRKLSAASEGRSSAQRRPPASHSSYGVETSCGPPPSFSTQRTLSQDRLWKPAVPERTEAPATAPMLAHEEPGQKSNTIDEVLHNNQTSTSSPETADTHSIDTPKLGESSVESGKEMEHAPSGYGLNIMEDEKGDSLRATTLVNAEDESKRSSSDGHKSEDLFLNIAKADPATQEALSRSERRRVRSDRPLLH